MHPILGDALIGFEIRSYGVFAALGMAIGLVVIYRSCLRAGIPRKQLIDLILWTVIAALIGAKVALHLVEWRSHIENPWAWVDLFGARRRLPRLLVLWQGGLVWYGGLFGGCLAGFLLLRRRGLPFGRAADAVMPGLALGHVWGRLGCFLAGCCFGKAGGGDLGVAFGADSQVYEAHAAQELLPAPYETTYDIHPVQLYEAGAELAIAAALLFWLGRRRRWAGQITLTYLSCYSAARFCLELYRGDRARGFLGDPVALVDLNRLLGVDGGSPTILSISQLVALLTILACAWAWFLSFHRRRRRAADKSVNKRHS